MNRVYSSFWQTDSRNLADRALLYIECKPINSRLIRARLQGRHVNITLIQCYASTNDSDEWEKDTFYQILQVEVAETPMQDVIIIAGELNAKVGPRGEKAFVLQLVKNRFQALEHSKEEAESLRPQDSRWTAK